MAMKRLIALEELWHVDEAESAEPGQPRKRRFGAGQGRSAGRWVGGRVGGWVGGWAQQGLSPTRDEPNKG